mmetsp:Transcript_14361/g.36631  ORF Transcript_14361/g.36631 Transcript_14361/m.36631 type:complete len:439 (-) Transcript_14361:937-2253(-)
MFWGSFTLMILFGVLPCFFSSSTAGGGAVGGLEGGTGVSLVARCCFASTLFFLLISSCASSPSSSEEEDRERRTLLLSRALLLLFVSCCDARMKVPAVSTFFMVPFKVFFGEGSFSSVFFFSLFLSSPSSSTSPSSPLLSEARASPSNSLLRRAFIICAFRLCDAIMRLVNFSICFGVIRTSSDLSTLKRLMPFAAGLPTPLTCASPPLVVLVSTLSCTFILLTLTAECSKEVLPSSVPPLCSTPSPCPSPLSVSTVVLPAACVVLRLFFSSTTSSSYLVIAADWRLFESLYTRRSEPIPCESDFLFELDLRGVLSSPLSPFSFSGVRRSSPVGTAAAATGSLLTPLFAEVGDVSSKVTGAGVASCLLSACMPVPTIVDALAAFAASALACFSAALFSLSSISFCTNSSSCRRSHTCVQEADSVVRKPSVSLTLTSWS